MDQRQSEFDYVALDSDWDKREANLLEGEKAKWIYKGLLVLVANRISFILSYGGGGAGRVFVQPTTHLFDGYL